MNRADYETKINYYINKWGAKYNGDGDKIVTEEFFDLLMANDEKTKKVRVELAIARAERNYNNWDHHSPSKEESTTRIFELVRELIRYK